ncbi:hypothetical protein MSPP1_000434 [Malassezia sp. CBS 17886]|nr:hypothetical protein MSPP1_000434 [Malassezia sp. CBS 17886]
MSVDPVTFEVQGLFYQNAYGGCIALAQQHAPAGVTDEISAIRLSYAARAALALGDIPGARQILGDDSEYPAAMCVLFLADYVEALRSGGPASEEASSALEQLQALEGLVEPATLAAEIARYNTGLALWEGGSAHAALEALCVTGAGNSTELECIALGVHILLSLNRVDLAEKEYLTARQWGDDALLVQFMEAWIALARGGRSTQQAYYVYDELSQASSVANTPNMVPCFVGKAAALAAQDEVAQAEAVLDQAANLVRRRKAPLTFQDPSSAIVRTNQAVLASLQSRDTADDLVRDVSADAPAALHDSWAAKRRELEDAVAAMG